MKNNRFGGVERQLMLAAVAAMSIMAGAAGMASAESSLPLCPDTPNCVSSRDRDQRHHVRPLSFDGPADQAWSDARAALLEEARTAIVAELPTVLRAESVSLVFRFVDDVILELVPDRKLIEVRSASRVGYWDLGVNRRRVERIRARFVARQAQR